MGQPQLSISGGKQKRARNANRNGHSRGRSVLFARDVGETEDHRSTIEEWVAVGGWRFVAVGGWRRLAVGGSWQLAVGGGWGSLETVVKDSPEQKKNRGC